MPGKYVDLVNGVLTQKPGLVASGGAGDANKLVSTGSDGLLDASIMPPGIGSTARTMTTSEALSAGDLINVHNSSGPKVRKADATTAGKEADGFVLTSAGSGASVTVYPTESVLSGLSGLTPGALQFLSTTAGARTETAPSGSGQVAQQVGKALSATEMVFRPQTPVILA
jgi:hypothetical protein